MAKPRWRECDRIRRTEVGSVQYIEQLHSELQSEPPPQLRVFQKRKRSRAAQRVPEDSILSQLLMY